MVVVNILQFCEHLLVVVSIIQCCEYFLVVVSIPDILVSISSV